MTDNHRNCGTGTNHFPMLALPRFFATALLRALCCDTRAGLYCFLGNALLALP